MFLGDGSTATLDAEIEPLVDAFVEDMRRLLTLDQQPSVHYSHSKCRLCPYHTQCFIDFEKKEDISLLYGIHGRTANSLAEAGITTITQLANSHVETIPDVAYLKGTKRKQRAIIQAQSYLTDKVFQLNKIVLPECT